MNNAYTHVNFGFEVAEVQHAVEGAIDTVLGFDRTIAELEDHLKDLLHVLNARQVEADLVLPIVRLLAAVRFQLEEAGAYRETLHRMIPPATRPARASS